MACRFGDHVLWSAGRLTQTSCLKPRYQCAADQQHMFGLQNTYGCTSFSTASAKFSKTSRTNCGYNNHSVLNPKKIKRKSTTLSSWCTPQCRINYTVDPKLALLRRSSCYMKTMYNNGYPPMCHNFCTVRIFVEEKKSVLCNDSSHNCCKVWLKLYIWDFWGAILVRSNNFCGGFWSFQWRKLP